MTPQPGSIVFAHTTGLMGKVIRFGEWLRWRRGRNWNHACIVDRVVGDQVYVIQAEIRGMTNDKTLDTFLEYVVIEPPDYVDAASVVWFARQQIGDKYGWWTIVSIAFDILSPSWFPSLRPANKRSNSWICSAVTGESLRFGGWYRRWPDIYLVTPAQLFLALTDAAL